jgi:hypothetical protein
LPRKDAAALESDKEVCPENGKDVVWAECLQVVPREDGMETAGAEGIQRINEDIAKEVTGNDGMEILSSREEGEADEEPNNQQNGFKSKKNNARRHFNWLWYALVPVVIIGVALGIGLGVGLRPSQ